MLLAHLSDLHLRDEADAIEFDRQLDRIRSRGADHLVITGDLLDWWQPTLLGRVLDALNSRGLLSAGKVTIFHGNHDLASGGGHPRQPRDLWRLILRGWDPPPLLARRKRQFYRDIAARAPGIATPPPFVKPLDSGVVLAVLDTIRFQWIPCSIRKDEVRVNHARGTLSEEQTRWLASLPPADALVVLTHHYPLEVAPYEWRRPSPASPRPAWWRSWLERWAVTVPMEIRQPDRQRFWQAAAAARAVAVLCGHVHRARVDRRDGIAVALNGQSGAAWAGRTIAYYRITGAGLEVDYESGSPGV